MRDMPHRPSRFLRRTQAVPYALAVLFPLFVLMIKCASAPASDQASSPFLLFGAAVMGAAWHGGIGPGIVATVCGAILGTWNFLLPSGVSLSSTGGALRVAQFGLEGLLISLLGGAMHSARRLAADQGQAAIQSQARLRSVGFRLAETEQALETEAQRLRRLVDANIIGVFSAAASGEISSCNAAFAQALGYSTVDPEQWPKNWKSITPDQYAELDRLALQEIEATGRCTPYEKQFLRADGGHAPMLLGAASVRDDTLETIWFALDLTLQKQAEVELLQAKSTAESASRAKSEFLTNVSHELRTPLNVVIGMTNLALHEPISDQLRDYLEASLASAKSLLRVLDDILDVSQLEYGSFQLECDDFIVRDLFDELIREAAPAASSKRLKLSLSIDDNVPQQVVGDDRRLAQIVRQLLSNAIKFTDRGEVRVRVSCSAASEEEIGMLISVEDTGMGIPTGAQQRVFAPFAQVDSSTTRRHGGVGLGLAIAARLAARMRGEITLESSPGQGSRFLVGIPLRRSRTWSAAQLARPPRMDHPLPLATVAGDFDRPPSASGNRYPAPPIRSLSILVVEDTPANQRLVCLLLEGRGHRCTVAGNGWEAVEHLENESFDLVLMDVQMPGMDGLEATAKIRQQESGTEHHLPIVAMTAHASQFDRERCLAAGMNAYLTKPIDAQELFSLVESISPADRANA